MKANIILNNVSVEIDDSTKIEFISNPKRAGKNAHGRYAKYEKATTFGEYLELNDKKFGMADFKYDAAHHFVKVFDSKGKDLNAKPAAEKTA